MLLLCYVLFISGYGIIHRVGEPTLQEPDVAKQMLEIHTFWASKRRTEPRIGENCTARRDECNGGSEHARNDVETLAKFLQRQVFAKSVPPPYESLVCHKTAGNTSTFRAVRSLPEASQCVRGGRRPSTT